MKLSEVLSLPAVVDGDGGHARFACRTDQLLLVCVSGIRVDYARIPLPQLVEEAPLRHRRLHANPIDQVMVTVA